MTPKVLLIAPHFGKFPPWIGLTFATFARNRDFQLLVVTDQRGDRFPPYPNIRFHHQSLADLSALATERTGTRVVLTRGYKVCDLRPAFGVIFAAHLAGYDYWGHLDLDTFWGDMAAALHPALAQGYEIICGDPYHVGGPFCLYKNVERVNTLFRKNPFHISAFQAKENVDFDEIGVHIDYQGFERTVRRSEASKEIRVYRDRQHYLQDFDASWWVNQVKTAFPEDTREYPPFEFGTGIWQDGKIYAASDPSGASNSNELQPKEYLFYHFLDGKRRLFRPFDIKWCQHLQSFSIGLDGLTLHYQPGVYWLAHRLESFSIHALKFAVYDLGPWRHRLGLRGKKSQRSA
ncbi:MAG: DUF6625 family protein [Synechococcales bacterium]|nr:DUF6625 family protein [Synechococcales bacterium]